MSIQILALERTIHQPSALYLSIYIYKCICLSLYFTHTPCLTAAVTNVFRFFPVFRVTWWKSINNPFTSCSAHLLSFFLQLPVYMLWFFFPLHFLFCVFWMAKKHVVLTYFLSGTCSFMVNYLASVMLIIWLTTFTWAKWFFYHFKWILTKLKFCVECVANFPPKIMWHLCLV